MFNNKIDVNSIVAHICETIINCVYTVWLFDDAQRHFQQYFSYIVAEDPEKTTALSQITEYFIT